MFVLSRTPASLQIIHGHLIIDNVTMELRGNIVKVGIHKVAVINKYCH